MAVEGDRFSPEDIEQAYMWLKREAYHETTNLFLRARIARFEHSLKTSGISTVFRSLAKQLNSILDSSRLTEAAQRELGEYLDQVGFRVLPKKAKCPERAKDDKIQFISNVRTDASYEIEQVNYWIDLPVELQIVDVLWVRHAGMVIDSTLINGCFGYRVATDRGGDTDFPADESHPWQLFRYYYRQYSDWRDTCISRALELLKNGESIVLVGLDFKQAFYHLRPSWERVTELIEQTARPEERTKCTALTKILQQIHMRYLGQVMEDLRRSHSNLDWLKNTSESDSECTGHLPVGLASSGILANMVLHEFDRKVLTNLRPSSYGRYVDDVLFVLSGVDLEETDEDSLIDLVRSAAFDADVSDEDVSASRSENDKDAKKAGGISDSVAPWRWSSRQHPETIMEVQPEKLLFHLYRHDESHAGLAEFKQELDRHASEFRFLPAEDEDRNLTECAYDLHYQGSVNKLRSLVGVSENGHKLSVYLARRMIEYRLTKGRISDDLLGQIFRYYKGRNIFDFCRTWEKALALLLVTGNNAKCAQLCHQLESTIEKMSFRENGDQRKSGQPGLTDRLNGDCTEYLHIALAQCVALLGNWESLSTEKFRRSRLGRLHQKWYPKDDHLPSHMRDSNMLRHYMITWPLLDLVAEYKGSLLETDMTKVMETLRKSHQEGSGGEPRLEALGIDDGFPDFDWQKVHLCPRFIHLDEYLLMRCILRIYRLAYGQQPLPDVNKVFFMLEAYFRDYVTTDSDRAIVEHETATALIREVRFTSSTAPSNTNKLEESSGEGDGQKEHNESDSGSADTSGRKPGLQKEELAIGTYLPNRPVVVGLANTKVEQSHIEAAYDPRKRPVLTFERQERLYDLINEASRKTKCDFIVLPEVSVPFSWLPFLTTQARRRQIGIVAGLEHVVTGQSAMNFVATILPFRTDRGHGNAFVSLRLKNHYSPEESQQLSRLDLQRPAAAPYYELYYWRGLSFSVYNCFELTDIVHRGLFRSKLDALVAVEYNKDTNYYGNIVGSTARDLHCYVVQANSSDFGDSRITSPEKTELMNKVQVKGGENTVLLKASIDIDSLRDFQSRRYSPDDKRFKPTPAGYRHEKARTRHKRANHGTETP